jgi:hypothetical protein
VSATGLFSDKNAGAGKTVNLSSSYSGADVGNYTITGQAGTTATITQAALTISGITAADKTYNASNAATVNTAGAAYNGLFAGDVVGVAATGLFSDKNAGAGKTVNLTSSYSGADAGNYIITGQAGTTATITQAALTVTRHHRRRQDLQRQHGSHRQHGGGRLQRPVRRRCGERGGHRLVQR